MRERHYLKTAFVGGQLITGRHNPAIQGSLGYKGFNMYRFKVSDRDAISAYLRKRAGNYEHSYNAQVLAQEIITDLLNEGLITYGGYEFKKQQKDHHSI